MGHWREDGLPLWQTSMITQPANGRTPALTEAGRAAAAAVKNSWNTEVFDSLTRLRHLGPLPDARHARLDADRRLQHGHPRDAEPRPGGDRDRDGPRDPHGLPRRPRRRRRPTVTEYLGYSRGHWDGDTLVIETTNFTPGISNGASPNSAQMKLTERLTPTGPDQIRYEAWIEDPVMLTAPYKIDMPWQRNPNYEFFEYACHEGNVQIRGYITATSPRFQKLREEQWAKQGEEPSPVAAARAARRS